MPLSSRTAQVFLLALGVLIFEIALTRIFAFMFFQHLTYVVIGVALLGFGAAGTYLTTRPVPDAKANEFVARHATGFGVSAVAAVVFIPRVHFYFEDLYVQGDTSSLSALLLLALFAGIPFFFGGAVLGFLVSHARDDVNRIYFADLAGAATGSLLAIGCISWLGGPGTGLAAGALGFLVAVFAEPHNRRARVAALAATVAFAAFVAKTNWLTLYAPSDKPLFRQQGEVERIEWDPIARIDVTRPVQRSYSFGGALAPTYTDPPPSTRIVYQDGGALTGIIRPESTPETTPVLGAYMQGAAYVVKPQAHALVLGCGGGVDVEIALHHGARHVVAVDVNPKMIRLLGEYADFTRGVFQRKDVELVVAEARHFLTRDTRKYDVIQLSGVDTYTALAAGAYALTEYFVYTRQAIEQYLDHLTDDGIFGISRPLLRPPRETLKLAITIIQVLEARGVPDPENHVILLAAHGQGSLWAVRWAQTMVKRSAWTPQEVQAIEAWATTRGFDVVYAPYGMVGPNQVAQYYSSSPSDRARMIENDPRDLRPATDDWPFFFHFYPMRKLWTLAWLRNTEPLLDVATIIALATLVQVSVLSGVLILWPLARHRLPPGPKAERAGLFGYFAALGLGFILIEIALLQKFTIFLGGPTWSMGVTLFSILLGSGLGSFLSRRAADDPRRLVSFVVPALAVIAVAAPWLWDPLVAHLLGLSRVWRVIAVVVMVAPVALLMGMPFPAGLRYVSRHCPELAPWGWGINACMTVLGTAVCALLTTGLGFNRTIQIAAAVYAVAWLVWMFTTRRTAPRALEPS